MILYSDRDVFVGAHVTANDKHALRETARRKSMSMSALVAQAIKEKLERVAHDDDTNEDGRDSHSPAA